MYVYDKMTDRGGGQFEVCDVIYQIYFINLSYADN